MTSEKEQFYIQRISELEAQLKRRDERIAALEKQVADLLKVNAELTCRKQGRSSWQFIQNALSAYYFQTPTPSLLPQANIRA